MTTILCLLILIQGNVNVDSILGIAKEYHNRAVAGEEGALKIAEQNFKRVLKVEPKNPVALVWFGSLLTIKGRDAAFPISKMKYVNEGLKYMDKAIKERPDCIEARWVRAQNNLSLPYFFSRIDTVIVDLEFLYNNSQEPDKALLLLGKAYKQKGEIEKAREYLNRVLKSNDSTLVNEATRLLKETEE